MAWALGSAPAGSEPSAHTPAPRDPLGYEEQLILSWNAPHGTPQASDRLVTACDDTSRSDTLYLSFRPGTEIVAPTAMECVLYFHPAPGDTLGPFWQFKRGWPNEGNMLIDFDFIAGFPCRLAWQNVGWGRVSYDHRSGRGRLDLSFKVEPEYGSVIMESELRCVGRVAIRQRAGLPGCAQPVCVEWASMKIRSALDYDVEITRGSQRVVSWNDPGGVASRALGGASGARPWRPPVQIGDTPATVTFPSSADTVRVEIGR